MQNPRNVVAFPLTAVDEAELRARYWELVFEGRRDSDDARSIQAELARRERRLQPDSPKF